MFPLCVGLWLVLMQLALSNLWKTPVLTSLRLLSIAQAPFLRSTSSRLHRNTQGQPRRVWTICSKRLVNLQLGFFQYSKTAGGRESRLSTARSQNGGLALTIIKEIWARSRSPCHNMVSKFQEWISQRTDTSPCLWCPYLYCGVTDTFCTQSCLSTLYNWNPEPALIDFHEAVSLIVWLGQSGLSTEVRPPWPTQQTYALSETQWRIWLLLELSFSEVGESTDY